MLLNLRELESGPVAFDEKIPSEALGLEDTNFRLTNELHAKGFADCLTGTEEIRIRGHISGMLEGDCDRCLVPARLALDQDFEVFYRPASMGPDSDELELGDDDTDVGYYDGDGVETADLAREQVHLMLPMHWICREDCKGMCPQCGANLNQDPCDCHEETGSDRWSALRNFHPSK